MLVKSTENDSLMIDMRRCRRSGCHCTVNPVRGILFCSP